MTPTEAANLLEISPESTPEQLEARFLELRTKLEDRIAKAPTPGLKAKYRESLDEITTAFETLTLAADSSSLPVLNRNTPPPASTTPPPSAATPEPTATITPKPRKQKSGSKEIVLVALVAVLLLGGGGWWLMQVRAENAEKARIAAEEQRLADEEQARLDQLAVEVRTQLAEYKIIWEVAEREERDAEKRVSELRTELRNLRNPKPEQTAPIIRQIKIAQRYYDWLRNLLLQHPTKLTSAKLEQLLQAKAYANLETTGVELQLAVDKLQEVLKENQNGKGTLEIQTNLPTLRWTLRDDQKRVIQEGTGPTLIKGLDFVRHSLTYTAPNIGGGGKLIDINPGKRYPLKYDFDYTRITVEDLPLEARMKLNGEPVTLLPDSTIAVTKKATLTVYRAGYLPIAKKVSPSSEEITFNWVSLSKASDLAEAYLELIASDSPHLRVQSLRQLQLSLRGTSVIKQSRWTELYTKVFLELDQKSNVVTRIKTLLRVAQGATIVDRNLTITALENAADLASTASNEDINKLARNSSLFNRPAWRWAPEAGKKFFAAQERAGKASNAFYGYVRAGLNDEADRVEQAVLRGLSGNNLKWRQNSYKTHRKTTEFYLNYVIPLKTALARNDRSAYSKIIATGIPESKEGGSIYAISTMLWNHGLQAQAMELHHENNGSYAPTWLIEGTLMTGRVDLLETWVSSSRSQYRNSGSSNARIGLRYALSGNKKKAREMLARPRGERDNKASVSELGERALAYEIIGDRDASKDALDSFEKHSDFTEKTQAWTIANAIYTLHRQGDIKRATQLFEKIKKAPTYISNYAGWFWTGQVNKATDSLLARLRRSSFRPATYQSFYRQWMRLSEFRSKDVPLWADNSCIKGLILAQLDYGYRNGKFNSRSWPTPRSQHVNATLKKRGPFYYPAAARPDKAQGTCKVEVTVDAKGKPTAYKTISTVHPAFATELKSKMATWEYFPALKMGKPTTGTYTFTANFNGGYKK